MVGKKNVIMMFAIHAEIEDCLVQIPFGYKVDKSKPLGLLQQLLGISYMKGPRAYTFALAILKAYTNSRHEQILEHLVRNQLPPEPEAPMDKVLLSVVDRRLVFNFTHKPFHTMPALLPGSRLQQHRLKLESLFLNESEVDKVFTEFVPMVPEEEQKAWPKPWHIQDWLELQQRRCKKEFNIPEATLVSKDTGITTEISRTLTEANGGYITAHTPYMSSTRPNVSQVSGGLHIYTLAIRLACNFVSSDPETEVIQSFAKVMFKRIAHLASCLESHLKLYYRKPGFIEQFQATNQNDIAAVTMVISPVEIHGVLETGIFMITRGLMPENPSVLQWSWIATEVHKGKVAFQNACEEFLAGRLPRGSSFFEIFG